MARTNIEETAWIVFYKLASALGVHPNMVAGTAASLWHESQEALQVGGSEEQIILWSGLFLEPVAEQQRWLLGLLKLGIITRKDDAYVIDGNESEIETRVTRMTSSAKGAASTRKKWALVKAGVRVLLDAPSIATSEAESRAPAFGIAELAVDQAVRPTETDQKPETEDLRPCPPAGVTTLNAMQGNAMQGKAKHEDATASSASSGIRDEPKLLGRFPIEDGFLGVHALDPTLSAVSSKTQRQWILAYPVGPQRAWLVDNLTSAIQHYQELGDFENFGMRLVAWINRQKKPSATAYETVAHSDPFALICEGAP